MAELIPLVTQIGASAAIFIVATVLIRNAFVDASERYKTSLDESSAQLNELGARYDELNARYLTMEREFQECRTRLFETGMSLRQEQGMRAALESRVAALEGHE